MAAGDVRSKIGPDKILGVTAKTIEQARAAQAAGADYLGSGAVFGSQTKKDAKSMTTQMLQSIAAAVEIPVVAIGGIDAENISGLNGLGLAGAAVVSGIFAQDDVEAAARKLRDLCEYL
jgi:thiamine-phosphate pyrophosphorylase